ncbi:cytochrome c3 family protein [Candidatus Viridilinea mediisalina]|uniref:Cytochrome C n=1 Tax=Candidatus Viridilinea mediisalina TaxID=2024553 RepID=A0A2A6RJZ6_9CHLR|nr:cytochrome c3 family protein [Candidatus Viridilinea mediisalina]PDW03225.1 cytochrome C [Candidatus Viridilinea mediisalina]
MSAQIFPRNANVIFMLSLIGLTLMSIGIIAALIGIYLSPWYTEVGDAKAQPIPFSHKHHVDELKIDCLYCHSTVEQAAHAGFPSTDTCMSCHSQIWTNSPLLEPARVSLQTGEPIVWNRIYDLPDFVFFNHSIHVAKGIGCASCHAGTDQQHLTAKAQALWMGWCLGCHRNPEEHIRPRDEIFNMAYNPLSLPLSERLALVAEYQIATDGRLTNCYACHR